MYIYLIVLILLVIFLIPTYKKPMLYRGMITEDECSHIIEKAQNEFEDSKVNTTNMPLNKSVRDSETAWLDPNKDPVIRNVMKKCLSKCDRPLKNCERLQVLRYKSGGFYKPHYDACTSYTGCYSQKEKNNQRLYTFIIGLNDSYKGGETYFPILDKSYRLGKGDVLKFNNLDNYGMVCGKAVHGGMNVEEGEKYICNVWVHTYPYKE